MVRGRESTLQRGLTRLAGATLVVLGGIFVLSERIDHVEEEPLTTAQGSSGFVALEPPAATSSEVAATQDAAATTSAADATSSGPDGHAPDSEEVGGGRRAGPPGASRPRAPGAPGTSPIPGSFLPGVASVSSRALNGTTSSQTNANTGPPQAPSLEDLPPGTGLLGQYWDYDTDITHIPNLDISGANVTRVDPVIDFPWDGWNLPFQPLETWATLWRGYLKVLTGGHYAFVLGSDDGALLELDNTVLCGADQLQGYSESRGECDLARGLHVIKIRYFNNRGPGVCKLFWVTPGGGDPAIVPQEDLYPAGGPADVGRPVIASALPDGAKRGDSITITGANFADIPSLNKVTFGPNNVPAVVTDATTTTLTVVIPNGVDQGPISLTVGDLTAPSVPYNVGGFFGLYARTWRDTTGDGVTTYQDPQTSAPPDDEQLFGPLDIRSLGAFNFPFPAFTFRTSFTGRFWAQAAGQHAFALESDDGSRLLLDGQVVVDDGGLHGRKHVDGAVFLQAGWHEIEVDFFQNQGDANVTLFHGDPGGALGVCPRGLLAPPPEMDQRVVPSITSLNPNPAIPNQRLLIAGQGLTAPDGRPPVVLVNNTPLAVLAASPGSIAVEIPFGIDSGALVVRAGPLATPPVMLQITGYGLKGEYWNVGHSLSALPSFDTPPTMTRTDDHVDFQEDASFKVPWVPDYFAVRWTGQLYVPTAGTYELVAGSDDGSRLVIDGQQVVSNDGLHGYTEVGAQVTLSPGLHQLELDFFENEGTAACRLLWTPPGAARTVIPRSSFIPPP